MDNYKNKYNSLLHRIKKVIRWENLTNISAGTLNLFSIILLLIICVSIIEYLAYGDTSFRLFLFSIFILFIVIALWKYLIPEIKKIHLSKNKNYLESTALRIGSFYPGIKDKLCNVVQLMYNIENKEKKRPDNTSESLALAEFHNVSSKVSATDFNVIIEKKPLKRSALIFISFLSLAVLLFIVFQSSLGAAFYRVVNFNKSFIPPAPFSLKIEPKDTNIIRGNGIIVKVNSLGQSPNKIMFYIKEKQQETYDEYNLKSVDGIFSYEIHALKENLTFFAKADWVGDFVLSDTGRINVVERPFVRSFSGKIISPRYTGMPAKYFDEQNGDISALKGSAIYIDLLANKKIRKAEVVVLRNSDNINVKDTSDKVIENNTANNDSKVDTLIYKMKISGSKATGNFRIRESGSYYLKIYDYSGNENHDPIKYSIAALSDDYPTISLIQPLVDVQVDDRALLPIKVAIADDYGFTKLVLNYRLVQSKYSAPMPEFEQINIQLMGGDLAAEIPYIWDLNKIEISPDDIYEYNLEIFDNDLVNGPKSAKTSTLMVKMPSLEEVLDQVDKTREKIEKELKEVLKKAETVKKNIDELNKELLKKKDSKEIDWKDRKNAEEIMNKQQELKESLKEIQKDLENVTQNLNEKDAISQETLQKFMELQKLLNEVNSPELERMRRELQNAIDKLPPEQIREAVKQVKFNEEEFRKSIERTMNLLKRLKVEQKADAIISQSKEVEKNQNELNKQTENSNPENNDKREELAKKQENIEEDFKNMTEELKNLEKLMNELDNMPMDEMEKAKETLDEETTKNEMQKATQNLKNGDFSSSSKSQKKSAKNLKSFSEQMQNMKEKMQNKSIQEAIRQMKKTISDVLKLSEDQEKLKAKTESTDYNSTRFPELLTEQAAISQALRNSINQLTGLSQKSFAVTPRMAKQLGDALNNMDNTLKQLAERNTNQAVKSQTQAMSSMNMAVMAMQAMLTMMERSNSCTNPTGTGDGQMGESGYGQQPLMSSQNFMEQLQQLANQQQGINHALQKMGNRTGMSPEQQAQLSRMAADQAQIQKSLKQLAEEQRKSQLQDGRKLGMGNLEKIAEEMEETISEMNNGRIKHSTLKRQERILSRLLDASRSIHERDKETRRESETGVNRKRKSPTELDLNSQEGKKRAMQELLKSIQQGYTKDYEAIIRKYFESLNN
jgi:hypothetical protein